MQFAKPSDKIVAFGLLVSCNSFILGSVKTHVPLEPWQSINVYYSYLNRDSGKSTVLGIYYGSLKKNPLAVV